jgi:hypothetical protein
VSVSTDSYSALMRRLRTLGGSALTAHEAQQVREAADARLFGDDDQMERTARMLALLDELVRAARLSSRTSGELADLLCAIDPVSAEP